MFYQHFILRTPHLQAWFIPCLVGRINSIEAKVLKLNARFACGDVIENKRLQERETAFETIKPMKNYIPSKDKDQNLHTTQDSVWQQYSSNLPTSEKWNCIVQEARKLGICTNGLLNPRRGRCATDNNISEGNNIDDSENEEPLEITPQSLAFLPLHLFAYETPISNEVSDEVKPAEEYDVVQAQVTVSEKRLPDYTVVEAQIKYLFPRFGSRGRSRRSIEKNIAALTLQTADIFPMAQKSSNTSDLIDKKNCAYFYREYCQDTRSRPPAALEADVEVEVGKKPQCLPPLGPPPVMQPPPPRQPPLPSCPPKKKSKKNKCSFDPRYVILYKQTTRFVGCFQSFDQDAITRQALISRCSKSVLEKASKTYMF